MRRQGDPPPTTSQRPTLPWGWIAFFVVWLIASLVIPLFLGQPNKSLTIPYTTFLQQVDAGNVVSITSQGDTISGTFKTAIADPAVAAGQAPPTFTSFTTQRPTFEDPQQLSAALRAHNVSVSAQPTDTGSSPLSSILFTFGPILLLLGGFLWLSRRAGPTTGGGVFGLGRSGARRYDATTTTAHVTFADVAGIDEVKGELEEIVDFLRHPATYTRLGGRMPRGVLLVGPPGTGKTLLARAVAGEAGVPFFAIAGSEFIEMIVGVGAARVRDLFAQAKAAAPAIIFLDELDAIGRRRGVGNLTGSNDEREQTLNQLLAEMDGFEAGKAVIVLAATNRADVLDPALLRPGRFDRRVVVAPPDRTGRVAILRVHTRNIPLARDVDLDALAAETPGLVGADLRNLVNEAALAAAHAGRDTVSQADLLAALEKLALGAERRIVLTAADRRRIAYHEAGHALVGLLEPEGDPVRRVTIVPHGQALGVTLSIPEADRYHYSEAYLRARLASALAGRAAERLVFGAVTTGAENDLKQATELARAMVTRWGMSEELGLLAVEGVEAGNYLDAGMAAGMPVQPHGDRLFRTIDAATRRILDECYDAADALLVAHRAQLDRLAEALVREESLDEAALRRVTGLAERPAAAVPPSSTVERPLALVT